MAESFGGRIVYGAADTLISAGVSAGIGAAVAAGVPALGIPVATAAVFCASAAAVGAITNMAINILLRLKDNEPGTKFIATVISTGVGVAAGIGICTAVGMPLSLAAGLTLTAACIVTALVVFVALTLLALAFAALFAGTVGFAAHRSNSFASS